MCVCVFACLCVCFNVFVCDVNDSLCDVVWCVLCVLCCVCCLFNVFVCVCDLLCDGGWLVVVFVWCLCVCVWFFSVERCCVFVNGLLCDVV